MPMRCTRTVYVPAGTPTTRKRPASSVSAPKRVPVTCTCAPETTARALSRTTPLMRPVAPCAPSAPGTIMAIARQATAMACSTVRNVRLDEVVQRDGDIGFSSDWGGGNCAVWMCFSTAARAGSNDEDSKRNLPDAP